MSYDSNYKINRTAANKALTAADADIASAVSAMCQITEDIYDLSYGLTGTMESPLTKLYQDINKKIETNVSAVANHMSTMNQTMADQISLAINVFGNGAVPFQPAKYPTYKTSGINFGAVEGFTPNKVESALSSLNNHVKEIRNYFNEAIYQYKALYNLGTEYPEVRENANTAANSLRTYADTIGSDLDSFGKDFNTFLDDSIAKKGYKDNETKAKLENAKKLSSDYTKTITNLAAEE